MRFKNDKERGAFLDDYRNEKNGWYLWKDDYGINRKMWRRDLADCSLVVEEQLITYRWPQEHVTWAVMHWYIVEDWNIPFADSQGSRTEALQKLKEYAKAGRSI